MAAPIENFTANDKAGDIAAALYRDGVAIVSELVAPEIVDTIMASLNRDLDKQKPGGGEFFGYRSRSAGKLFERGPEFCEHLLLNPLTLEVTDELLRPKFPMAPSAPQPKRDLTVGEGGYDADYAIRETDPDPVLGPFCHHYRVNISGSIQICGGGTDQPLHREMDIYKPYMQHDPARHECILALGWAGTEFTADNGATRIVPGSHLWERGRKAEPHEVAQAVMPKGSVVFWVGKAYHGAGANRTDQARTGIIYTYTLNWLNTEQNQYLTVPPEVARTLPEQAQRLLGYRASAQLGSVPGLDSENLLLRGKSGPFG